MAQSPDIVVVGLQELIEENFFKKVGSLFKGDQGVKIDEWTKNFTKAMNTANEFKGIFAKEEQYAYYLYE
jgi:hypothetical protein